MVMGDMVLFEDEVNPLMSVALNKGLEVTALHSHFFFDEPKVYFMHIGGEGAVDRLAEGVRAIFDQVKEIRTANAQPAKSFGFGQLPEESSIDGEAISQVFAQKGDAKDGMYKVTIGRETKMACGCTVGNTMGINTWAAFAGTSDNALVVGDFVMLENELQRVLKTLRGNGISIVAIHQHMTGENPRMMFLHYYGRGKALGLAQAIKALRTKMESEWTPQLMHLLDIDTESLPIIWDADFLYGPRDVSGEDTYVLCEINVSSVLPFPEQAPSEIAQLVLARLQSAKKRR
jgi:hypothetical protein